MATPKSDRLALTPKTPATITAATPFTVSNSSGSRVLRTPLSDEAIWKRLKEAGFDEESIKRRDKAALIAYIAKLEAEVSPDSYGILAALENLNVFVIILNLYLSVILSICLFLQFFLLMLLSLYLS